MIRYLFSLLLMLSMAQSFSQDKPKQAEKYVMFYEKAYLHTDRELYGTGEAIWYKAYLVNAQTNRPLISSRNLYVELISPSTEIISRQVIRLDKSVGRGDFKLGEEMEPGLYKIRAYTNWMRNFGDDFVFEKNIRIARLPALAKPAANEKKKPLKPVVPAIAQAVAALKATGPVIDFFPEGGSLVEGVSSRVAFKIQQADGKGIASNGSILSSKGDTITTFSSNATGMGSFYLKPVPGLKYTASGVLEGKKSFIAQLPPALLKGFGMFVQEKDSLVTVMAFLNEATLAENQGKKLWLIVKQGIKTEISTLVPVEANQVTARIIKSSLEPGINAIILYDAKMRPQCERLVFIPQREKVKVDITPDKAVYKPKEKVTLSIKATDSKGAPVKTNLSLAVTDAAMVQANAGNIQTYLLLQSELKGKIESPQQYFDPANPDRQKQLELLLLTHGWSNFLWKKVADSTARITRLLEQGITISGVAKQAGKNKPLANANIGLRIPQAKGPKLFATQTDSLGRYYFDNMNLYGAQIVKLSSLNSAGELTGRIMMDSLFSDTLRLRKPLYVPAALVKEDTSAAALFVEQSVKRRVYKLSDTIQLQAVTITAKKNKPIILNSGRLLFDMGYPEENFTITKEDYSYQSLMHYLLTNSMYATQSTDATAAFNRVLFKAVGPGGVRPIVVLNGKSLSGTSADAAESTSPAADTGTGDDAEASTAVNDEKDDDVIATLTMDMIEKLNIKKLTNIDGSNAYILTITTKPGALDWKEKAVVVSLVNGYYQAREFYSPANDAVVERTDSWATVFWQPDVITNEKGEATVTYINGDAKSDMRILAEGLNNAGAIIVAKANYKVQ